MLMNQNKDRFKSSSPFRRHRLINDVRPAATRNFPDVGMTLPTYRTLPSAPAATGAIVPPAVPSGTFSRSLPRETNKKGRTIFTVKRVILVIFIILLLIGGWVGGKFIYNALKVFHGNVFSALTTTKLKGEDVGRVNILLAGYSVDDPQNTGGQLTDSIMLVSLDTHNNTAFMMSIPRDLYVDIPGHGYAKINEAYEDGQSDHFSASGYPDGGMGLLEEVVSQDLGIPIDYYALLNNDAVVQAVDAVGGITITIQSPDPRGIYDSYTKLKLPNGTVTLNGQQALALARARCDASAGDTCYGLPNSDFDRTEHQRQMLVALRQKAMTLGVVANPIKLGELFDAFGNNVKTDLTLSDAHRLYDLGKQVGNNNLQSYGLNSVNFGGRQNVDLLQNYWTATGQEALVPATGLGNYSQIQLFIKQITSSDPIVKEAATVVVLNGTNVYGLATKISEALSAKSVNVTGVGDAQSPSATTTIIDVTGGKKPATLGLLKSLYGNQVTTTNPYAGIYNADFILVVGNDHAQTSSTN